MLSNSTFHAVSNLINFTSSLPIGKIKIVLTLAVSTVKTISLKRDISNCFYV